jgi:ABC-2 type transport system ATP-binding protein
MDITIENLTKKYGPQLAVDNISFKVKTGEILGFLGPNGAGKTTAMKIITCFFAPTSGSVKVGDYSISEQPHKVKEHVGYLPELNVLYPDMFIIDYLKFIAKLHDIPKEKISERVYEMIQVCGLDKEKHKKIRELSKGYKQRVGLAQALIHDPEVLILDEPTEGLDPNQIVEIRELIKKIGREKTVILSSHILSEVEATCDRFLIINNGQIMADGTAEELKKGSQDKEVLRVAVEEGERNEIYKTISEIDTVEEVDFMDEETDRNVFKVTSKEGESSKKSISQACINNGWYVSELTPLETKLEDIFRNLTQN